MLSAAILDTYKSNEIVGGLTYGQWTVEWWKWALSMPASINPLEDETGSNAFRNQPKNVWFLGGTFGKQDCEVRIPTRHCKIPALMPILIPVINCQADKIDIPTLRTDTEILVEAQRQANSIVKKICKINGEIIVPERVASDPSIYEIAIHKDFTKEKTRNEISPASGDGYWVFLKGLPNGHYSIQIEGACEHGTIRSGAHYVISII